MGVFTLHVRNAAGSAHGRNIGLGTVHGRGHIHAKAVAGAEGFTVHRTGGVSVLEVPYGVVEHGIGCIGTGGIADFVADGPHDNRGVVFQSVEGGVFSVDDSFLEFSLVVVIVFRKQGVAFRVGLCQHIQAPFIGQPVQVVIVGVVGGADGVQVVFLHQPQVFPDGGFRHVFAVNRVGIVTVCPLNCRGMPLMVMGS